MDKDLYKPENLNEKQMIAYKMLTQWVDQKFDPEAIPYDQAVHKDVAPILLQIQGKGGSGKSFFLHTLHN